VRQKQRRLQSLADRTLAIQEELGELRAEVIRNEGLAGQRFIELRDSLHLAARRATLMRSSTRVLFLVHHIEAWDAYHELVRAMESSTDFQPVVASIPRTFPGSPGPEYEKQIHEQLDARGVSHLRLAGHGNGEILRLIKIIDPDLIFRQSQWDSDISEALGTDRLHFSRLCYVPYETMNIVSNVPDATTVNSAVDSRYHRAAWVVFCTNDSMLAMSQRDGARGGAQFRVTGHLKADRLRTATPLWPFEGASSTSRRHRLVWSPHHSIASGWTDFGAFPAIAPGMLAWARTEPDVEFVLMPHPALIPFTSAEWSPITRLEFDAWLEQWCSLPNATVSMDGDYAPLLAASDILITDGLSLLIEYQVLTKPLLFFERSGHREFNEIGKKVLRGVHTVHSLDQARAMARRYFEGSVDPHRGCQISNVEELFGSGNSTERIIEVLRGMIDEEQGNRR